MLESSNITVTDIDKALNEIYGMMRTGKQIDKVKQTYGQLIFLTNDIIADDSIEAMEFGDVEGYLSGR